jgi:hypothetical protein
MLKVGQGLFDIALSVCLVMEYEDAARRRDGGLKPSDDDIDDILDYLCAVGRRANNIHYLWRPYLRDPKDDHVLELAVSAGASVIVTYNKRDFTGVEQFGIALFSPGEFLKRLEMPS